MKHRYRRNGNAVSSAGYEFVRRVQIEARGVTGVVCMVFLVKYFLNLQLRGAGVEVLN